MAPLSESGRPSSTGTPAVGAWRAAALLGAAFLIVGAHPVRAAGVVGNGTPESCSEAALDDALAGGGMVTFDCGSGPVTITVTSTKTMSADTTIDGGNLIAISGGNNVGVFYVNTGLNFTVQNLTISNGNTNGGAIYSDRGTVTLTNSTLSGNSAPAVGGGIYSNGTLTVTDCTLSDNLAGDDGGGIANYGTLTLTNCTLSGNSTSGRGGGISNGYQGTAILTNCTLSDNAASAGGGGISNSNWATAILTNCTLSDNAATFGGGIYNSPGCGACGPFGSPIEGGRLTLRNTIVANSPSGGDCPTINVNDGGHNLIEDTTYSCGLATGVNDNIVGIDPLLDPDGLKDNGGPTQTIALLPGSPAINAGDPQVCANPPVNGVDQRGFVRPGAGHTQCSIGAYEADAVSPELCVGDCDGTGRATIDELITLVNIALGTAQAPTCPHGVPTGADVDVALIIQAVNVALTGCGG